MNIECPHNILYCISGIKYLNISLFLGNRLFLTFVHLISNSFEHLKTQGHAHILNFSLNSVLHTGDVGLESVLFLRH